MAPKIQLRGLGHSFGSSGTRVTALDEIDLSIRPGRFVSLIGPSGCGKSTIFNVIAGLETPTAGAVLIDGEDVTGAIGVVGYMLQKDLLLNWRTILDNVILGMELQHVPKAEARAKALPYLKKYGLGGFESRYPWELSGGMRQRAALLRTILYDSEIILLDEPFGALDAQTRSRMQEWLLDLWRDFGKTVLFVTHDVEEAVFLSDEIHVMTRRPGRIKASLEVELPRPRSLEMVAAPEFIALKQRCVALLAEEAPIEEAAAA